MVIVELEFMNKMIYDNPIILVNYGRVIGDCVHAKTQGINQLFMNSDRSIPRILVHCDGVTISVLCENLQ